MPLTTTAVHTLALLIGYGYGARAMLRIHLLEPNANRALFTRRRRSLFLVSAIWPIAEIGALLYDASDPKKWAEVAITFLTAIGVGHLGWQLSTSRDAVSADF